MKFALALLLLPTLTEAAPRRQIHRADTPTPPAPPSCEEAPKEAEIRLPYLTGYAPGKPGPNGSCRGGASRHRGFFPCRNTLHSYRDNPRVPFIHTAAQQRGGSAKAWGCYARTNALRLRKIHTRRPCDLLAVVDRYGPSENADRIGGKTKVDIEVRELDSSFWALKGDKVAVPGGTLQCVKRAFGVKNEEKLGGSRKVQRNPAAATRHRSRARG